MWIPPSHYLNVVRLAVYAFIGTVAVREAYQLLSDKKCKRLGAQAWICIACILTETLICIKFGRGEFTAPFPTWVIVSWSLFGLILVAYPIYQFVLVPAGKSQKISNYKRKKGEDTDEETD